MSITLPWRRKARAQKQCRHLGAFGIFGDAIIHTGYKRGYCPECDLFLDALPVVPWPDQVAGHLLPVRPSPPVWHGARISRAELRTRGLAWRRPARVTDKDLAREFGG